MTTGHRGADRALAGVATDPAGNRCRLDSTDNTVTRGRDADCHINHGGPARSDEHQLINFTVVFSETVAGSRRDITFTGTSGGTGSGR
jgi:hypothetical protein